MLMTVVLSFRRLVVLALLVLAAFLAYSSLAHYAFPDSGASRTSRTSSLPTVLRSKLDNFLDLPVLPPANGTLGFGAIVAVSRATSSRRESLLLAANITELEITIPHQPIWTDDDVASIKSPDTKASILTRGSALAWLGHLNVLRWFLASELETIFIIEDDVDWDIHLRTTQIPAAAASVRHLLGKQRDDPWPSANGAYITPEDAGGYWGPTHGNGGWDIMYLGHCGDMFGPEVYANISHYPRATFSDPTIPAYDDLHFFTRKFLDSIAIPEQTRLVHRSVSPLCTFGFGLTRAAATALLHHIAPRETLTGCQAYDVRILEACRDLGLRCWTANPELFHHQDRPSEIALVNQHKAANAPAPQSYDEKEEAEADAERARVLADQARIAKEWARLKEKLDNGESLDAPDDDDEDAYMTEEQRAEQRAQHEKKYQTERERQRAQWRAALPPGVDAMGRLQGAAPNLRCGARGTSMFTKNEETMLFLREVVGRQGRCLRDQLAEDLSVWP